MKDIALNSQLETYWTDVGDVGVVDGVDRIEQGIVIRVIEEVDLSAPPPTESAIEAQRSAIETAVENTDVSRPPIDVFVAESPLDPPESTDSDEDVLRVVYEIQTSRVSTQLTTE